MKTQLPTTLLLACLCLASRANEITLTVNNQPLYGAVISFDEVSIAANEVAEIKSLFGNLSGGTLKVIKNGATNSLDAAPGFLNSVSLPLPTVAGPAKIRLEGGSAIFCTVKIEPESFPPDKTIIIPQGTPGANIIMEQSSDLVHWTNSVPGLYTNTAENHLFFRLRADRL